MKFIKHFYYPYYYIETFNGSILSLFFLDNTFHFEDEEDLFLRKFSINASKKGKKVIDESVIDLNIGLKKLENDFFVENFFVEFFCKNDK